MCKLFVLSFMVGALLYFALWTLAHADEAACNNVQDSDTRHYCRALVEGDPAECNTINNDDLRNTCRARLEQ